MSAKDPGVIFDASNSWNGYNHQGRVALYVALETLCEKWDTSKSIEVNSENLKKYFLELEYLEDFSIGVEEEGDTKYISVHQVKCKEDDNLNSYDSALLGLIQHIIEKPEIKNLYLHVTRDLKTSSIQLSEKLNKLKAAPAFIEEQLNMIEEYRAKEELQNSLLNFKSGRRSEFKKNIVKILKDLNKGDKIDINDLKDALDRYEQSLKERQEKFATVNEENIKKIGIYKYPFEKETFYCPVDKIQDLILKSINKFYGCILPAEAKYKAADTEFHKKCFLYLCGKLMHHVVERDLYYYEYKKEKRDRKIKFSQIIEWLNFDEIDKHSIEYYLDTARVNILDYISKYCENCKAQTGCKDECRIEEFRGTLVNMSFGQLKDFIYATSPQLVDELERKTYGRFVAEDVFVGHFPRGLKEIKKDFIKDKSAVTYHDNDNKEYVLTSIRLGYYTEQSVCTEIAKNRNIDSILRECDGFISKDIDVASIEIAAFSPICTEIGFDGTNITRWKNVRIIPLDDFKNLINK